MDMPEFDRDPIHAAFADFRSRQSSALRPAGMAVVRDIVRRRRRVRIAAAAVLTTVAIVIPATAYGYLSGGSHAPQPGGSATRSASPSAAAAASPSASPIPSESSPAITAPPRIAACRAADLSGTVTDGGSLANQPFVIIALTNTSGSFCHLGGYPKITGAIGYPWSKPSAKRPLSLRVTNGSNYERTDPGPRRIELAPQAAASFAMGTGTAYGPEVYTITSLRVIVPGDGAGVPVVVNIDAGTPGGSIPALVTAFVAGRAGPP
jgi:hypothetical protein